MLLYCDVCDKAFHTFCLKPRLNTVPSCGWRCHDCFKCIKCGTTSFFKHREEYYLSKKIDYSISKDFSLCIECSIDEYHRSSGDLKCEKCGEQLKYTSEDIDTKECLNCLIKNKMCNSKAIAIKNCELYLKIHQISTRHSLLSFLCKHILAPFLDKFGDSKGALIKNFVDENTDFFREDIVIMDWLNVLEMGVKFENEEIDPQNLRGGRRKLPKFENKLYDNSEQKQITERDDSPNKSTSKLKEMSKQVYSKIERRRRKYKKRQIEYIGWHYEEVNETTVLNLNNVVTHLTNNEENLRFYEYIYLTSYLQDNLVLDKKSFDIVYKYVLPVILGKTMPTIMNESIKCLYVLQYYTHLSLFGNDMKFKCNLKSTVIDDYPKHSELYQYLYKICNSQTIINKVMKHENKVGSLASSLQILSVYSPLKYESNLGELLEEVEFPFSLTQKALFLQNSNSRFVKNEYIDEDIDMQVEGLEESKSRKRSRSNSKPSSKHQRVEKEINYRQWDINLRDKLNLNKYTKTMYMSQGLNKHRMSDHKDSSLSKRIYSGSGHSKYVQRGYTGFDYNNQNMFRIIKPEEPEKIMKDINLDKFFEVDYVELLTKYEFPAVLRLKKKFMVWFCKYMHQKIQLKKQELEEKKQLKEEQERRKKIKEEEEADAKARRDGIKVEQIQTKAKVNHIEVHDIEIFDALEDNPTKILQCSF